MLKGNGLDSVLGLELVLLDKQRYSMRYCQLRIENKKLNIVEGKVLEGTLPEVMKALPKGSPVALVLSGKGVVHKNVESVAGEAPEQVFSKGFAGIDAKEFYIQQFDHQTNFLISIIRKVVADPIVAILKLAGFSVYALSLGAAVSGQIWSQLNVYGELIAFDGHEFILSSDKAFLSYRYEPGLSHPFPIKIEQEVLSESLLVSYSAAFQLLLHEQLDLIVSNSAEINQAFLDYHQDALLKKKGGVFLACLFIALLISFAVFSHYNAENNQLNSQVGALVSSADQIDVLKKNIAENEKLLRQLNWNGGYNYGFILNEVGNSMPKQLRLTEINSNLPNKDSEDLNLGAGLKVAGYTGDLAAVNNWMFVLREKKWIKAVRLINYKEDAASENYLFNMLIEY